MLYTPQQFRTQSTYLRVERTDISLGGSHDFLGSTEIAKDTELILNSTFFNPRTQNAKTKHSKVLADILCGWLVFNIEWYADIKVFLDQPFHQIMLCQPTIEWTGLRLYIIKKEKKFVNDVCNINLAILWCSRILVLIKKWFMNQSEIIILFICIKLHS